ncbi:MAG TPA: chromosome segregation protein SMC [Anaerolineae bacterium]|nr:chromosome segregation protein SMC [Anaerolineae bacterium]
MRLKHLELHGFKTFATQTEFIFPTGITAIVGPNGSGKSNVADCVRWVLGEQTFSALRAKKTEDLIFAGGEGRARSGMAEAYLTLDNSDGFFPIEFSEVTIGRRAYRDGDNEYLLNGSKVRLREIQELLAQTGLARRTYTVVGQGLIDQALSLRAEERRALFEEAAGISLYQHKREDALRRLDETQRNLERVKDILAEIGPRVRQLERQARRAQDYTRLSGELQEMQRVWFGYHWGRLQNTLGEAKASCQAQDLQVAQRRAELADAGTHLEQLRRRQLDVRTQLSEWQRQAGGLHTQIEALQRQLAVLAERARLIRQQASDVQADIAPLETQIAAQTERVAEVEHNLAEMARTIENQAQAIETARRAVEERQALRHSILQQLAATQDNLRRIEADTADRHNRRRQLDERRTVLEAESTTHRHDTTTLSIDLSDAQAFLASIESELAQLHLQIDKRRERGAELAQQLETIRARQAELDAESAQALRAEAELRARFDALRAARASLAGFDSGARNILSARLPGVRGAMARLIDVERGWERALEAALGTDLQAVLLDAWAAAEAARVHLGESGGRATLIPLDSLRRPEYALPPGARRVAELVMCDAAIRPAVEALLGHIVAVADLAEARALLPTLPPGVHIVTQAGEVLRSNGAMMVGRAAGAEDLMAHEREWRELPAALQAAAERAAAIESRRTATAARANDAIQQQATLADAIRQLGESSAERTTARNDMARRIESIEREIAWKNGLIEQAEAEARGIAERDTLLAQGIERLAQDLAAQRQRASDLDRQLVDLPLEELAANLTSLHTAAALSEQLRQGQTGVLQSHRAALEQSLAQLETRRQRITAIADEQAQLEVQLAAVREQEAALAEQQARYGALIGPAEAEVRRLDQEYAAAENDERAARNRLQETESRYNLAVMDMARKEDELNHLRARINEELGLVQLELADLTAPQPLPLAPIVTELPTVAALPEELESEMQRLKAHIRRLGPINPEAQAEYHAERERYEFLSAQSEDLGQAIEQLRQVIAELDQLMEKSFSETFHAIAEEFKQTFTQLFGGGSARLVLTEPENVTQTGVDISARPPGKKQQGLALLSGGERSLTAAALLFAILKVKPPPFCILDETDAALDEANVGRFREMIRAQSAHTQFVLITHNRGTIEAADTIYGITMERDSSSHVYSLKLEGDKVAT